MAQAGVPHDSTRNEIVANRQSEVARTLLKKVSDAERKCSSAMALQRFPGGPSQRKLTDAAGKSIGRLAHYVHDNGASLDPSARLAAEEVRDLFVKANRKHRRWISVGHGEQYMAELEAAWEILTNDVSAARARLERELEHWLRVPSVSRTPIPDQRSGPRQFWERIGTAGRAIAWVLGVAASIATIAALYLQVEAMKEAQVRAATPIERRPSAPQPASSTPPSPEPKADKADGEMKAEPAPPEHPIPRMRTARARAPSPSRVTADREKPNIAPATGPGTIPEESLRAAVSPLIAAIEIPQGQKPFVPECKVQIDKVRAEIALATARYGGIIEVTNPGPNTKLLVVYPRPGHSLDCRREDAKRSLSLPANSVATIAEPDSGNRIWGVCVEDLGITPTPRCAKGVGPNDSGNNWDRQP